MSASGTDDTDWAGLLDSASSGNGGGLNLTLTPDALQAGARACHVLLSDVMGYLSAAQGIAGLPRDVTSDGIVHDSPYASQWGTTAFGSLGALFGVFNGKMTDVVNALQNHQQILTDMGETFNAAAQAYQQAEVNNSDLFTVPSSGSHIDLTQDLSSGPVAGTDGYWGADPHYATGAGSGVTMDPTAATQVSPESSLFWQDLPDYANIADIIDKYNGLVSVLADQWQSMAGQLARSITTFQNSVGPVYKGWGGSAASVAQSAVSGYVNALNDTATSMTDMFNVVANTNEFLYFVWQHMPKWSEIEPFSVYNAQDPSGNSLPTGDRNWVWDNGTSMTLQTVDTFLDSGDSSTSNQGYKNGMNTIVLENIPYIVDPNTVDGASGNLSGDYNYNPTGSSSTGSSGDDSSGDDNNSSGNNNDSGSSGTGNNNTGGSSGNNSGSTGEIGRAHV